MKAVHVAPHQGGWKVKSTWSRKAHRIFPTQTEAMQVGKRIAIARKCELIVHRQDGSIRSKDSFGPDPFGPRKVEGTR